MSRQLRNVRRHLIVSIVHIPPLAPVWLLSKVQQKRRQLKSARCAKYIWRQNDALIETKKVIKHLKLRLTTSTLDIALMLEKVWWAAWIRKQRRTERNGYEWQFFGNHVVFLSTKPSDFSSELNLLCLCFFLSNPHLVIVIWLFHLCLMRWWMKLVCAVSVVLFLFVRLTRASEWFNNEFWRWTMSYL